jgi:hypothetical protein
MPDFGIFRGFNDKLFGDKLYAGQLPTQLGIIGSISLFDIDALAFINAAAITDLNQQIAINTLVEQLKINGIWTKMKAIYPIVGGTASSHKYNLKDPRDLDVAYRLTFSTGLTHSSSGINFAVGNNFALVNGLNLQSLSQNNTSFAYYNKSVITFDNVRVIVGINTSTAQYQHMIAGYAFGNRYAGIFNNSENDAKNNNLGALGFKMINRVTSTNYSIFDNGSKVQTITNNSTTPLNTNITLGRTGTGSANIQMNLAFFNVGDGLTDTEASNFYTAVQAFQTTLNRNV